MQINAISKGVQPTASPEKAQLEKTAKQFEAIFLRQMIGTMRQSGGGEGIFDSSATEQFSRHVRRAHRRHDGGKGRTRHRGNAAAPI